MQTKLLKSLITDALKIVRKAESETVDKEMLLGVAANYADHYLKYIKDEEDKQFVSDLSKAVAVFCIKRQPMKEALKEIHFDEIPKEKKQFVLEVMTAGMDGEVLKTRLNLHLTAEGRLHKFMQAFYEVYEDVYDLKEEDALTTKKGVDAIGILETAEKKYKNEQLKGITSVCYKYLIATISLANSKSKAS